MNKIEILLERCNKNSDWQELSLKFVVNEATAKQTNSLRRNFESFCSLPSVESKLTLRRHEIHDNASITEIMTDIAQSPQQPNDFLQLLLFLREHAPIDRNVVAVLRARCQVDLNVPPLRQSLTNVDDLRKYMLSVQLTKLRRNNVFYQLLFEELAAPLNFYIDFLYY